MKELTNDELIEKAGSVINTKMIGEFKVANVGAALVTDKGNVYLGVSIDVGSGVGFCAEHSAIAAMVTAGEYKMAKIVAVWKDEKGVYVVSPCGRCREFIRQIDKSNIGTEVILSKDKSVKLSELLPYSDSFEKV
ncbi:MAG: cytidine deaminase [Nanoarchaeota archaeon]|nr:cytidine deaminase [Nanoarchaeota archaeon]MCG2717915.1 cytidine deaminase [Nanoarchaeota archaeon]